MSKRRAKLWVLLILGVFSTSVCFTPSFNFISSVLFTALVVMFWISKEAM